MTYQYPAKDKYSYTVRTQKYPDVSKYQAKTKSFNNTYIYAKYISKKTTNDWKSYRIQILIQTWEKQKFMKDDFINFFLTRWACTGAISEALIYS